MNRKQSTFSVSRRKNALASNKEDNEFLTLLVNVLKYQTIYADEVNISELKVGYSAEKFSEDKLEKVNLFIINL